MTEVQTVVHLDRDTHMDVIESVWEEQKIPAADAAINLMQLMENQSSLLVQTGAEEWVVVPWRRVHALQVRSRSTPPEEQQ